MRHDYKDMLADIYTMVGRSDFAFRDVREPLTRYSANGSVMRELVDERLLRITGRVERRPGRYVNQYRITKNGITTATTATGLRSLSVAVAC